MIEYIKGDLFSTDCKVIAHGCNAQGVMGAGVAKIVKQKYYESFRVYRDYCLNNSRDKSIVGTVVWFIENGKIIANCITQEYWGYGASRLVDYDAIKKCMANIKKEAELRNFNCIAMPKIGAGLGGGDWNIIAQIINTELKDITVKIYEL